MVSKKRVLFVCTGNICRSPAAEGVFRAHVDRAGLSQHYDVSSAGTIDYHEGELPDSRMRSAARKRGYDLSSRARAVRPDDLRQHDLVVAMDRSHQRQLLSLARKPDESGRIKLFMDFHPNPPDPDVPDPYYGGAEGFDHVLDLIEAACEPLLQHMEKIESQ